MKGGVKMGETEKLKEIKAMVSELERLRRDLWKPAERFYKLRKEIASSVDFLERLCKTIERATKKDFKLTMEIVKTDDEILDKFFGRAVSTLDEVKKEIQERWEEIKERR